jgi:excisionase family DNA binding protein
VPATLTADEAELVLGLIAGLRRLIAELVDEALTARDAAPPRDSLRREDDVERRPLITAREVAAELGVSAETILRWSRAGQIPAVKLPHGGIRYAPKQIDVWLANRTMGAARG